MACKKASHDKVDRRRFLQAAVMGAASMAVSSEVLQTNNAFANQSNVILQEPPFEVTAGTLIDIGVGWLEIQERDQTRRIALSGTTSFWKGGESVLSTLSLGDDIMVRAVTLADPALRIWANLSRIQGKVLRTKGNQYGLQIGGPHTAQKEMVVEILDQAQFQEFMNHTPLGTHRPILVGDALDVVGELTPNGLRATLVSPHPQNSSLPIQKSQPDTIATTDSTTGITSLTYYGYATWFSCPTGTGRCGCNASSSSECAWPAMDSGCSCCSLTCCNCSKNCANQAYLSCGAQVTVTDNTWLNCTAFTSVTAKIVDCGPCQKANCATCSPEVCTRKCSDCKGFVTPVVDLTRPTFARFYDHAVRMCFSCTATV